MQYWPCDTSCNEQTSSFEKWSDSIVEEVKKRVAAQTFRGRFDEIKMYENFSNPEFARFVEQRLREELPCVGGDPLRISVQPRDSVSDQHESGDELHIILVRTQSYEEYDRKYGWVWMLIGIFMTIVLVFLFAGVFAQGLDEGVSLLFG